MRHFTGNYSFDLEKWRGNCRRFHFWNYTWSDLSPLSCNINNFIVRSRFSTVIQHYFKCSLGLHYNDNRIFWISKISISSSVNYVVCVCMVESLFSFSRHAKPNFSRLSSEKCRFYGASCLQQVSSTTCKIDLKITVLNALFDFTPHWDIRNSIAVFHQMAVCFVKFSLC